MGKVSNDASFFINTKEAILRWLIRVGFQVNIWGYPDIVVEHTDSNRAFHFNYACVIVRYQHRLGHSNNH